MRNDVRAKSRQSFVLFGVGHELFTCLVLQNEMANFNSKLLSTSEDLNTTRPHAV